MCSNILPCPLCCQPNFQSIDSLRISLVNVTNRPLECPICSDVLYGLDKLTIHLFSHSLNQNNSVQTEYDNDVLNVDLSTQQSEKKILPFSNENIVNQRSYESCSKSPNKTVVEPHCDICGSTFRTVELQRMHLKLVHEVNEEDIQRNGLVTGEKDAKNYFPCHLCSKCFKMKGSLRVHLKVVHSFGKTGRIGLPILDGYQQSAVSSNNAIESHGSDGSFNAENKLNNVEVKAFNCDICAKSFTTKYFLKKHKRLHTGLKLILFIRHRSVYVIYFIVGFQEKCPIRARYAVRAKNNNFINRKLNLDDNPIKTFNKLITGLSLQVKILHFNNRTTNTSCITVTKSHTFVLLAVELLKNFRHYTIMKGSTVER